jgi:arsenate reductase (glutaredoxin)
MRTTTLHGIANCDTVRRARSFLAERSIEYGFHDFKKLGVPAEHLDRWIAVLGWEPLVNRKGNTWRQLDEALRNGVVDAASARSLMLSQPSVIKRPVVEWANGSISVGFDSAAWSARR